MAASFGGCSAEVDGEEPPFEESESLGETQSSLASYARSIQSFYSGKCLHASSLGAGAQVQQATCSGSSNQQFLVESSAVAGLKQIRNTAANLCLVATGYSGWGDPEVSLVLASCSLPQARWTKESPTAITDGERTGFRWAYDSGYCAHVPSSSGGVQLVGRACTGGSTQRFDVRVSAPPPPPPPPPPCPSGQFCCEPEGSGCALCVPNGAYCP